MNKIGDIIRWNSMTYFSEDGKRTDIFSVIKIKETDILRGNKWLRTCSSCKREQEVYSFAYEEDFWNKDPDVDKFCQICWCC